MSLATRSIVGQRVRPVLSDRSTDPARLSRRRGSNSHSDCLDLIGLDKLVSRINLHLKVSVSVSQRAASVSEWFSVHTGHQDDGGPRNLIEEFDPGSA